MFKQEGHSEAADLRQGHALSHNVKAWVGSLFLASLGKNSNIISQYIEIHVV